MISRAAVVAEARSWVGTRWKHQAYLKGLGADCIGLIGGVALALNLPGSDVWAATPEYHNYGRQPDSAILLGGCELLMDPIAIDALQPADILVMRFEREPQHFAIVSALEPYPSMIHAYAQARKVAENRIDEVWRRRIFAAFHLRGVG